MRIAIRSLVCPIICLVFTFAIAIAAFAGDIDKNTVGIWMFDEGDGDEVKDLTDNHNDGVIEGDLEWVEGKFGKALEFSNGSVMIPNSESLDISEEITIETWITFSHAGVGMDMVIAREEPAYSLQKFSNDTIEGWVSVGGWQGVRDFGGRANMEPEEWYHVAFTYDGDEMITYINGEVDRENAISGAIDVADVPFTIGSFQGTAYFWIGKIDEVRVSNVARTQNEIKAVMSGFQEFLAVAPSEKLTSTWGDIKNGR